MGTVGSRTANTLVCRGEGVVQCPLFHKRQTTLEVRDLQGSEAVEVDLSLGLRAAAPAEWKLDSWVFMVDQSVRRVAAVCSQKVQLYASQTCPLN